MIDRWIAEATECDFKVALEVKKPKSWLKSVSAFANGIGGTLFFGIDDDRNVIGLSDAQTNAETISRLIKERITPYPSFILAPERESGKDILVLSVSSGRSIFAQSSSMKVLVRETTQVPSGEKPGFTTL